MSWLTSSAGFAAAILPVQQRRCDYKRVLRPPMTRPALPEAKLLNCSRCVEYCHPFDLGLFLFASNDLNLNLNPAPPAGKSSKSSSAGFLDPSAGVSSFRLMEATLDRLGKQLRSVEGTALKVRLPITGRLPAQVGAPT